MYVVPEALNILDDSNMPQIAALNKNCQEELAIDLANADGMCGDIMGYITEVSGGVLAYDQRIFNDDWDKIEDPVCNFFSPTWNPDTATIFDYINVSGSTKTPVFEMGSSAVGEAFVMDNLIDYSEYVEKLVAAKSPVMIYAGEFDAQDGPKTQEYWLRRLNFEGSEDFWSQSRQIYWVQNKTTTETQLINGGYWRTSDYFEYLTVPKAGHFVPNNYFSPSYAFVEDYIKSKKLVCHDQANGCSVVEQRCSAMNYCNGNGSCDTTTAQCVCNEGYKFADCSKKTMDLTDGYTVDVDAYGPGWFTMQYSGSDSGKLYLTPNITSEVYILKDASGDPNNFVYDMSFKTVNGNTTFDTDHLGLTSDKGFSVAVYMPAVNETANELLEGRLSVYFANGAASQGIYLALLLALIQIALF